jgi:hypothetical protein
MMRIPGGSVALLLALASFTGAADPNKCSVKLASSEAPKELAEPVRQLLSGQSLQVAEGDKVLWEIWLPKQLAVKATGDEVQKGINYRKLEESTILGVMRVNQAWNSFRKQTIKPGLYTLRLGFQPMDGDHMGTAPFNEFLLLCPAADDKKAAILSHKEVSELSGKAIPGGSHPAVLLLYPNLKPGDKPELANKGSGNWVLNWKTEVAAGGQKGVLGVGFTLFGATTAE